MGICKKAERISLEVSAVLELLYDKGKDEMKHFHNSSYSVEDMAVSEASIKFSCQKMKMEHMSHLNVICFHCTVNAVDNMFLPSTPLSI
jgi:hypothetical protein